MDRDGVVYCLSPSFTYRDNNGRKDETLSSFNKMIEEWLGGIVLIPNEEKEHKFFWESHFNSRNIEKSKRYIPVSLIYKPDFFFERMKLQKSIFTFHPGYLKRIYSNGNYHDQLNFAPPEISDLYITHPVYRLIIPRDSKRKIVNLLQRGGINISTIYPEPI